MVTFGDWRKVGEFSVETLFHCEALIDHVPPSGNASDLSSCPLSQFLGFHFKKSHLLGILFLHCLVQVQAFNDSD